MPSSEYQWYFLRVIQVDTSLFYCDDEEAVHWKIVKSYHPYVVSRKLSRLWL